MIFARRRNGRPLLEAAFAGIFFLSLFCLYLFWGPSSNFRSVLHQQIPEITKSSPGSSPVLLSLSSPISSSISSPISSPISSSISSPISSSISSPPSSSIPSPLSSPRPSHPPESPPKSVKEPQEDHFRTYQRVLVVARTTKEDVSWIDQELRDLPDLRTIMYTVDDPKAQYHVPKNKGNEVMVYLTYMIDNYDSLGDVTLFMHSHQNTWHNSILLDSSAARMVKRLNVARVIREGYSSLRCELFPGCPAHIHPFSPTASSNTDTPEEAVFADAWREIFPNTTVPTVIASPCCSQFALSKKKIRSIPREKYVQYRDWLLQTKLPNKLSGRVWEYLWQVVFVGVNEFCPKEHVCYCDLYGICFGGDQQYQDYSSLGWHIQEKERDRDKLKTVFWNFWTKATKLKEAEDVVSDLKRKQADLMQKALEDGMDPRFRAHEVGRNWSPGDGF